MTKTTKKLLGRIEKVKKALVRASTTAREQERFLFVVGCQRSGTSLMMNILDRDYRCTAYREGSEAFEEQVLKPTAELKRTVSRRGGSIHAFKPLLDSHRTDALLETFQGSYAIWMYRHYRAVAASSESYFNPGVGLRDLAPIVANDQNDWRNKGVSAQTRRIVCDSFFPGMGHLDACALFWWVRNRIYFDLGLHERSNVFLCRYEDLIGEPQRTMRSLYASISSTYPGDRVVSDVHRRALERGRSVELSPAIEDLCGPLQRDLDDVANRRRASG